MSQKKRQLNTLIDKINLGFGCLLIDDPAYPVLPKEDKIELYMYDIALLTAIEPYYPDGRKWRAKLVEQGLIETRPDDRKWLIDGCFQKEMHGEGGLRTNKINA